MTGHRQLMWGRILLGVCSVAALVGAAGAVPVVAAAGPQTRFVEAWRGLGFATFAVLFLVLARRPQVSRGLWAAVVGNKLALTVIALAWAGQVSGASQAVAWDGTLTVLLLVAAALTRAWTTPRAEPARVATAGVSAGRAPAGNRSSTSLNASWKPRAGKR